MKSYPVQRAGKVTHIIADEWNGFLTWPGTRIPFMDQEKLATHAKKAEIEASLRQAETGKIEISLLWENPEILALTLKPLPFN